MSMLGSPVSSKVAKLKEEKAKVKEKLKSKVDSKELVRHTLVKNKHKTLKGGQKNIMLGGPRVKEARKVFSSQKDGFRTNQTEKNTGNEFHLHRGKGKVQKRKGKGGAPSSIWGFSLRNTQWGRTWSCWWIRRLVFQLNWRFLNFSYRMVLHQLYCMDDISPFESSKPSDARCSGSWLHTVNWIKSGNLKGSRSMRCIVALRQSFAFATSPSCLPTLGRRLVWESCIMHFPTALPCCTKVGRSWDG